MTSPARTTDAPRMKSQPAAPLLDRIAQAIDSWSSRLGEGSGPVLEEFAEAVAAAAGPEAIAAALARSAHRAAGSGAIRAEVWRDGRRAASWPAPDGSRRDGGPAAAGTIELPLRFGGRGCGTLRVVLATARPIGSARRRRLAALAVLAAAAESALARPEPAAVAIATGAAAHPTHDLATGLPNATFFESFLAYALALADRRDESLSLLYIAVDRLAAIHQLHGPAIASEAIRRVGRTIAGALRRSDLIARLDDGRLVAVLPGATAADGLRIAEHIRAAVASAGAATPAMPVLTASIGMASFPEHAGDAMTLRAAAAAALSEARAGGRDRVASAEPPHLAGPPTLRIAQAV